MALSGMVTSNLDSRVESLDLERLKWKIMNKDSEGVLSPDLLDKAKIEYKRFLTLLIRYPGEGLAPTELMDLMWHAHILDSKNYFKDCQTLFGHYMHHSPNFGPFNDLENESNFNEMSNRMDDRYQLEFGELPVGIEKEDCGGGCRSCEGTGPND